MNKKMGEKQGKCQQAAFDLGMQLHGLAKLFSNFKDEEKDSHDERMAWHGRASATLLRKWPSVPINLTRIFLDLRCKMTHLNLTETLARLKNLEADFDSNDVDRIEEIKSLLARVLVLLCEKPERLCKKNSLRLV